MVRLKHTTPDFHVQPGRNLSGCFDVRVLLRKDALLDCCIAFLPVDGVNNLPDLFSLLRWDMPAVGENLVLPLCGPVSRFLLGLQIPDEWIGRREAGIASLTLNARLLLGLGAVESIVISAAACGGSHETLNCRRELRFLLYTLETFAGSTGLRIDLAVDCFR